jgi:ATP-binding protein involved in chromosome partitioning
MLIPAIGYAVQPRRDLLDCAHHVQAKVIPMSSAITETMVYDALRKVMDPELRHNIVELGFIQEIDIVDDYVHLEIQLTTPNCPYADTIVAQIKHAVEGVQGVKRVEVERACMKEL